jgi:DNA-binding NtrC family response regulator
MTSTSTVLLVESDILLRHPLAQYLRECGFTVYEASNGDEAMIALKSPDTAVDVVLADMATTGSGFALQAWIRSEHPHVKRSLPDRSKKLWKARQSFATRAPHWPSLTSTIWCLIVSVNRWPGVRKPAEYIHLKSGLLE